MFEFNTWARNNLISGVRRGAFSREWAAIKIADYIVNGKMTAEDAAIFDAETVVTEISDVAVDNSVEG